MMIDNNEVDIMNALLIYLNFILTVIKKKNLCTTIYIYNTLEATKPVFNKIVNIS